MGSTELAANLFRATQTDEKLRREKIRGKALAGQIHKKVGEKVRQTIKDLGGTMPEDLPTPQKALCRLNESRKRKSSKSSPCIREPPTVQRTLRAAIGVKELSSPFTLSL